MGDAGSGDDLAGFDGRIVLPKFEVNGMLNYAAGDVVAATGLFVGTSGDSGGSSWRCGARTRPGRSGRKVGCCFRPACAVELVPGRSGSGRRAWIALSLSMADSAETLARVGMSAAGQAR
jgi:hypothetical protein